MKITNNYKSTTKHNLSKRAKGKSGVKYLVIHYTGSGTSSKGAAKANCQYFNRANRNASADFFIDDGQICRYNPNCEKYYSWHCGDGKGKNGITNSNSIGIEVCIDGDKPYTSKEIKNLKYLVKKLSRKYKIDESHIVRHYDASGKLCPLYYTPKGEGGNKAWKELKKKLLA